MQFTTKFNLLAEALEINKDEILKHMSSNQVIKRLNRRVTALEIAAKQHTKEIELLKANKH